MYKRLLLSSVVILAAASGALSQNRLVGRVTDVVDGKTVRLEMPTGNIRAELQNIEVPEPEQPLHQTIRDHLKALTIGRSAEFVVTGLASDRTVGQLFVNGVDVGAQMLRDGGAWLVPAGNTANSPPEYAVYVTNETQAKAEKIGVWSVPGLKPAWQFRAEKAEVQRQQEEAAWLAANRNRLKNRGASPNSLTPGRPQSQQGVSHAASMNAWNEVIAGVGTESYGLHPYHNDSLKFDVTYTSGAFVDAPGSERKIECRAAYVEWRDPDGTPRSGHVLMFRSLSDDYDFSRRKSSLTIVIDGRGMSIGGPRGLRGINSIGAHEIFGYRISKSLLTAMARARDVQVRIDGFTGRLPADLLRLMKQLADAT